jgi:hypothetical protein
MTFLELCQAAALDSGLISSQNLMTTATTASTFYKGRGRHVIDFTVQAWKTIQTGRNDWVWMRASFNGNLVIGQASYTPAQVGIATRFRAFIPDRPAEGFLPHTIYDAAIGRADETPLCQISPATWRMMYDRGAQTNGRPLHYALENGQFLVGPAPDKTYAIRGRYFKSAQILVNDGDVPELPSDFHDVIKWRAIEMLHGQDGAFADRTVAQAEYSRLYRLLVNEQTEPTNMDSAIA